MSTKQSTSVSFFRNLLNFIKHPKARATALFFIVHGLMISTWVAQIPSIKSSFELNDAELGNVLLALPLGVMLMNMKGGLVLHYVATWRALIIGFFAYAISFIFIFTVTEYWMLFANLFFVGWTIGVLIVGANTLATRIENSEGILIMSSCHAVFSLGAMIGAGISSLAISIDFPPIYQMMIITSLFAILILSHRKYILQIPENSSGEEGAVFGFPNKELWLLILIGASVCFGEGVVVDWSAIYLREELGTSDGIAALGYGACALMMMVSRFSGDVLLPRLGTKKLLFGGGVLISAGLLLIVLIQIPIVGIFGFSMMGLGLGLGVPLLMSLAARTKGFSDGAGVGIFATFSFIAFIIEPPMIGWISEKFSLEIGFLVAAVIGLVGSLFALTLKRG